MKQKYQILFTIVISLWGSYFSFGQILNTSSKSNTGPHLKIVAPAWVPNDSDFCYLNYIENKGQWYNKVLYQADFKGGRVFLEKNALTYVFFPPDGFERMHPHKGADPKDFQTCTLTFQAIRMEFLNGQSSSIVPGGKKDFYNNYFLGNDPQHWAARTGIFEKVFYNQLYPGVSVKVFSRINDVRYDFTVSPNTDPAIIKMQFTGQNGLSLKDGKLVMHTELGDIEEEAPFAYQLVNGQKVAVGCHYTLSGENRVGFKVTGNYDKSQALIIDPTLVFATYTGSTADNWGMSATYDPAGDGYTSGICFDIGYPVTVGAFQLTFQGGGTGGGNIWPPPDNKGFDIVISKFNPSGTNLLFSTYLGGSDNEEPSSLVVDNKNNLVVLGRTYSTDFPTTVSAFSRVAKGGADLIVTKFDSSGTLLASTYVGGSADDGVNMSSLENVLSELKYNYADDDRGDVIVDDNNNVYVASCTNSTNFPTTPGAYKTTACGMQDGCAFELDPNLSVMKWSTYIGGNNNDAAYNLALNSKGEVYITGGTESPNFPVTPGVINPTYGGNIDGFLLHLSANGSTLLNSTYLGTGAYDQSYFVQADKYDNIYVYGQTAGAYPVSAGVYTNPHSGQFIHELNGSLTTTVFSTVFGTGSGNPDIAPSAFLVDNCQNIYVAGWGGLLYGYNVPTSTTYGLPVTANAYQPTTTGANFYFMVLQHNASALWYATFFGGPYSQEHVDGGTSRFDKNGVIYQSICQGCGGYSDMPTTPGAWSSTNNSPNCNNAIVKFQMDLLHTVASFIIDPLVTAGCAPFSVTFRNTTSFGNTYKWYFGDGDSSVLAAPSHIYATPGYYKVTLIATDSSTCNITDSAFAYVRVVPPLVMNPIPNTSICFGDSINLKAIAPGAITFAWTPPAGLSKDSISNPNASPAITTQYVVIAKDSFCSASDSVTVQVFHNITKIIPVPAQICLGDSIQLTTDSSFTKYVWSTGLTSSAIEATKGGQYYVNTVDKHGCKGEDTVNVEAFTKLVLQLHDTAICLGHPVQLMADSGNYGYMWSPANSLNSSEIWDPIANPTKTTTYTVIATNGPCISRDSLTVTVYPSPHINASPDSSMIIYGQSVTLIASGDSAYEWSPAKWLSCTECAITIATPDSNMVYYVNVKNKYGCSSSDSVIIDIEPTLYIPDAFSPNGDGKNDVFRPQSTGYTAMEVYIFDRWGELLYHWNTLDGGWDGRFHGDLVQEDVYVYLVKATTYTHQTVQKIGSVTLLR